MEPPNTDTVGDADLDDDHASLDRSDVDIAEVDDDEPGPESSLGEDGLPLDDEDDDGLAPEAGRHTPSALSLILLVAGAVWIVVALLKLSGGPPADNLPPVAIEDQADAGVELPNVDALPHDTGPPTQADGGQNPPDSANSGENGQVPENPELSNEPEVGTPASERGPPEDSLLAGKNWPRDYAAPDVVTYTIKRGGSMKVVANLYKIYHHEIEALNPGVPLERELPPATKIVVYRAKPGISSQSVGYPGSGSVEGGMPMVDGPGRILRHTPWKAWATRTTVATMDMVLREWARRHANEQPIIVGNMSARNGGRLKPHSSHQSGRDVDLSYPQIWDHKAELAPQVMSDRNLDRRLTWELLELLQETGAIEAVFIDSKLQKLLFQYALETQRYSEKQLENWMEYPRTPGTGSPIIQHVKGHADHLHVRFKCTPAETRCASRDR